MIGHKVRQVTLWIARNPYNFDHLENLMSDKPAYMSNRRTSIPVQSKVSLTLVLLVARFVLVFHTILQFVVAARKALSDAVPFGKRQSRVPPPMHLHYLNRPLSFTQLAEGVVSMVKTH